MSKPILLLLKELDREQVEQIKEVARQYEVVLKSQMTEALELDQAVIIFGWNDDIGRQILDLPTSRLRWIQAYSAGVDSFPLDELRAKNIVLTNASGVHATPITESVIGMLLNHYRNIGQSLLFQTKSEWNNSLPITELSSKKMLVVGTGQIGQHLAKIAYAFDVTVYGISRSGRQLTNFEQIYPQTKIAEVIAQMDIVINILPLTQDTHHFYNDALFEQMKEGVVFINVGRGPSVDTEALIAHCRSGKISFAGLDVFEEEPLPATSDLWQLDNVLITPHISGVTDQYDQRTVAIFSENLKAFSRDSKPSRNQVNLSLGY